MVEAFFPVETEAYEPMRLRAAQTELRFPGGVPENRGKRGGSCIHLCPQALRFYLVEAQYRVWLSIYVETQTEARCSGRDDGFPLGSSAEVLGG